MQGVPKIVGYKHNIFILLCLPNVCIYTLPFLYISDFKCSYQKARKNEINEFSVLLKKLEKEPTTYPERKQKGEISQDKGRN